MNESLHNREPMNDLFLQWAKDHVQDFEAIEISLEIRKHTKEIDGEKLPNPSQVVFLIGKGIWERFVSGCLG